MSLYLLNSTNISTTTAVVSALLHTTPKPRDVGFNAAFDPNLKPVADHTYYPVPRHVHVVEYGVMALVGANLVGLGGQMHGETLFKLIQSPGLLVTAMFCRLAILPAILLGLISCIDTGSAGSALSCLCLLMSPSEGASSLLVLLAEADVELCFALVAFNAFTTTAVLPLWAILYERELYGYAGELAIPFSHIFLMFFVICTAGFLGYLLCDKWPHVYDRYWSHLPLLTVITLLVIVVVEIYLNVSVLSHITALQALLSVLLAGAGLALGAGLGYVLCQSRETCTTLALELGVRTSYITNLCASMSYPPGEAAQAKTAAVLAGLLTLLPAIVYVLASRLRRKLHYDNHKPE